MAFRRRGSFSGRSTASKRQIANLSVRGEVDGAVAVVGIVKAAFSMSTVAGEVPVTLVRTRGQWTMRLASFPPAVAIWRAALGIIVVSADAFAIGVTALPGPLSDSENDWVVWSPVAIPVPTATIDGQMNGMISADFDSRGMRKLKEGDVLAAMFELESDVAGGTVDVAYILREQFKT